MVNSQKDESQHANGRKECERSIHAWLVSWGSEAGEARRASSRAVATEPAMEPATESPLSRDGRLWRMRSASDWPGASPICSLNSEGGSGNADGGCVPRLDWVAITSFGSVPSRPSDETQPYGMPPATCCRNVDHENAMLEFMTLVSVY
jgi:hypothetical protein